jgi:hypothetical protein
MTAWDVAGEPAADMEHWHLQGEPDTCAIAIQEFVLDSLTGRDFTEAALVDEAADNGWYEPGQGTPVEHVDSLLEAHGLETDTHEGGSVAELAADLDAGEKVIVAVDGLELATPLDGRGADHAVEVIGVAATPSGPAVVLNDPGQPDGRGAMLYAADFDEAWADANRLIVSADRI